MKQVQCSNYNTARETVHPEATLATRNWSGQLYTYQYSSQSAPKKKCTKLLEYTQEGV